LLACPVALLLIWLDDHGGEVDVDVALDKSLDLGGEPQIATGVALSAGVGAAELEELPASLLSSSVVRR
jgi:hypothetical protein